MSENGAPPIYPVEVVALSEVFAHPRNYREHGDGQRRQLLASLEQNGVYRNVVVARDGTLLAGHGVVEAAREAGLEEIPVVRLPLDADDPRALRILAADNELARLAVVDENVLADLLREVHASDEILDLLGTGFDEASLATLFRTVEGRGEPTSPEEAWVGMPTFEQSDRQSVFHTTVHFASWADVDAFFEKLALDRRTSFWWPESDGLVGSDARSAWVAS